MLNKTPKADTKKIASAPSPSNKLRVVICLLALAALLVAVCLFRRVIYTMNTKAVTYNCRISAGGSGSPDELVGKQTCDTMHVLIADNRQEMEKGLSGREHSSKVDGMLFVYQADDPAAIWMKGMRYPLHIAWLDADRRVTKVLPSLDPSSYPRVFQPDQPARYILEVDASNLPWHDQIQIGDRLDF